MKVYGIVILLLLSSSTLFGQSQNIFPAKQLFWTNLQEPNYLDSLKKLGYLRYTNKGVVYNKTFQRTIVEPDSTYSFNTTLDFYKYHIRWTRKGKKQFIKKDSENHYYYLGFAAAIFEGAVMLKQSTCR